MSDLQVAISETLIIAGAGDGAKTTLEVVKAAIPALPSGLSEGIESIAQQVGLFRTIAQQQAETIAENTQAVLQNTAAQQTGGAASVAGSIASTAAKVLGGGLGLVPLVSSIVGLFRGNKQETPAALPTYTAPEPIHYEGAAPPAAGMPILPVDYGQDGLPRPIRATAQPEKEKRIPSLGNEEEDENPAWLAERPAEVETRQAVSAADIGPESAPWLAPATALFHSRQAWLSADAGREAAPQPEPAQWQVGRPVPSAAPVYAPAVTVQVQAMDSRSFLDHSNEIARAVREAILNSHALGSVVSEL